MELTNYELNEIYGGAVTATLLNSIARLASTLMTLGQMLGSAARIGTSKNYCK